MLDSYKSRTFVQDEGWQLGVLKTSWESPSSESGDGRGLFPENFTKRLTD